MLILPGGQTYAFPEDYILEAGAQVSVRSGPRILDAISREEEGSTLVWTQRHVWNNKGDVAKLLDPDGTEAARCTAQLRYVFT